MEMNRSEIFEKSPETPNKLKDVHRKFVRDEQRTIFTPRKENAVRH